VKTATLQELLLFIQSDDALPASELNRIVDLIHRTLFREIAERLGSQLRSDYFVPTAEPAWPHISYAYEMQHALLSRMRHDLDFIHRLMRRLAVPDAAEREAVARLIVAVCEQRPELSAHVQIACWIWQSIRRLKLHVWQSIRTLKRQVASVFDRVRFWSGRSSSASQKT
jgi:hypothetical protein